MPDNLARNRSPLKGDLRVFNVHRDHEPTPGPSEEGSAV
jgi:hypothetical protein